MNADEIKSIGIVGAGQMGAGIAQVATASGWSVLLYDVSEAARRAALRRLGEGLARAAEKGGLPPDQIEPCLARIRPTDRLDALAEAQLVIEAAPEDAALKGELFRELGRLCKPEAVLASNTSAISITKLGAASGRPDRVVGLHFMNPVPVMRLVEVVRGLETSDATTAVALAVAQRLGKTPVVCRDGPGFIVNRVLMPMLNEAIFLLQEQPELTPEQIDQAMTAGTNQPVGPLALADRIGLDTVLAICEVLHQDLGDPKFRPCPLLRRYVAAGRLGRKSGRGFYVYDRRS
ncbi:3-hydroxyacyl-CoA dehydrogenase family protein [Nitrospira sp. Kam-Ns4a]